MHVGPPHRVTPPPPCPGHGGAACPPPPPGPRAWTGSASHAWPADMQSGRDSHRAPPRRPVSLKIGPQIKSNQIKSNRGLGGNNANCTPLRSMSIRTEKAAPHHHCPLGGGGRRWLLWWGLPPLTQTAPAQESCKLPSLHITHIMHNWKSHEQRIGRHPQEHTTVILFHCLLRTHGLHLALAIYHP